MQGGKQLSLAQLEEMKRIVEEELALIEEERQSEDSYDGAL